MHQASHGHRPQGAARRQQEWPRPAVYAMAEDDEVRPAISRGEAVGSPGDEHLSPAKHAALMREIEELKREIEGLKRELAVAAPAPTIPTTAGATRPPVAAAAGGALRMHRPRATAGRRGRQGRGLLQGMWGQDCLLRGV
jgi:hypothetical protein